MLHDSGSLGGGSGTHDSCGRTQKRFVRKLVGARGRLVRQDGNSFKTRWSLWETRTDQSGFDKDSSELARDSEELQLDEGGRSRGPCQHILKIRIY